MQEVSLRERTGREWLVRPLLCFTDATVLVHGTVNGVAVVEGANLARHGSWQKCLLSDEEAALVEGSVRKSATVGDQGNWLAMRLAYDNPCRNIE